MPHSSTFSDYMLYGAYTAKVLVLKRFIPSLIATKQETGKNVSAKYVLVE